MASSFKFYYFDYPGKGETIRFILNHARIPHEEVTISRDVDWPKFKPEMPFGQVPVLEIDGKKFAQSLAIGRFLAKGCGLAGRTDEENLKIDATVEALYELYLKTLQLLIEKDETTLKFLEKKYYEETLPTYLATLESQAFENEGFIAINKLTWADFAFVTTYESVQNFLKRDVFENCPNLLRVKANVLEQAGIREYLQIRRLLYNAFYDLRSDIE